MSRRPTTRPWLLLVALTAGVLVYLFVSLTLEHRSGSGLAARVAAHDRSARDRRALSACVERCRSGDAAAAAAAAAAATTASSVAQRASVGSTPSSCASSAAQPHVPGADGGALGDDAPSVRVAAALRLLGNSSACVIRGECAARQIVEALPAPAMLDACRARAHERALPVAAGGAAELCVAWMIDMEVSPEVEYVLDFLLANVSAPLRQIMRADVEAALSAGVADADTRDADAGVVSDEMLAARALLQQCRATVVVCQAGQEEQVQGVLRLLSHDDHALDRRVGVVHVADPSCSGKHAWAGHPLVERVFDTGYRVCDSSAVRTQIHTKYRYVPIGVRGGFSVHLEATETLIPADRRRYFAAVARSDMAHPSPLLQTLLGVFNEHTVLRKPFFFIDNGPGLQSRATRARLCEAVFVFLDRERALLDPLFFEALECGTIPVVSQRRATRALCDDDECPFVYLEDFDHRPLSLLDEYNDLELVGELQTRLLQWWRVQRRHFVHEVSEFVSTSLAAADNAGPVKHGTAPSAPAAAAAEAADDGAPATPPLPSNDAADDAGAAAQTGRGVPQGAVPQA